MRIWSARWQSSLDWVSRSFSREASLCDAPTYYENEVADGSGGLNALNPTLVSPNSLMVGLYWILLFTLQGETRLHTSGYTSWNMRRMGADLISRILFAPSYRTQKRDKGDFGTWFGITVRHCKLDPSCLGGMLCTFLTSRLSSYL